MGRPSPLTPVIVNFAAALKADNKTLSEIVAAIKGEFKVSTSPPAISKALTAHMKTLNVADAEGGGALIKNGGPGGASQVDLGSAAAGGEAAIVPLSSIEAWQGNPRRTFRDESIEELADSFAAKGILQPILVRPDPMAKDTYLIIAGERRYRAAGRMAERKIWTNDTPIPVVIRDVDDAEALELALIENLQRDDVPPLEEGDGFRELADLIVFRGEADNRKAACVIIGQQVGKTGRHIELRIALTEKLGTEARLALSQDQITLAQARALTTGVTLDDKGHVDQKTTSLQASIIDDIENGYGNARAQDITEAMTDDLLPLSWAAFDLAEYDGEIIVDPTTPDDPEQRWFADTGQARERQKALIAKRADHLKGGAWAFVITLRHANSEYFYPSGWQKLDDGAADTTANAGCVIEIKDDLSFDVHMGVVPTDAKSKKLAGIDDTPAAKDGPAPRKSALDAISAKHLAHARKRKTTPLQRGVMKDSGHAMRLVCLALIGGGEGAIGIKAQDYAMDHDVEILDTLQLHQPDFDTDHPLLKLANDNSFVDDDTQTKAWGALQDLDGEALENLFATLVAAQVYNGYPACPGLGDDALALSIAQTLKIAGQEHNHGLTLNASLHGEDLDGLQASALEAIATDAGATVGKTAKATRDAIREKGNGVYTPPTLRYATAKAIGGVIAAADSDFINSQHQDAAE